MPISIGMQQDSDTFAKPTPMMWIKTASPLWLQAVVLSVIDLLPPSAIEWIHNWPFVASLTWPSLEKVTLVFGQLAYQRTKMLILVGLALPALEVALLTVLYYKR